MSPTGMAGTHCCFSRFTLAGNWNPKQNWDLKSAIPVWDVGILTNVSTAKATPSSSKSFQVPMCSVHCIVIRLPRKHQLATIHERLLAINKQKMKELCGRGEKGTPELSVSTHEEMSAYKHFCPVNLFYVSVKCYSPKIQSCICSRP